MTVTDHRKMAASRRGPDGTASIGGADVGRPGSSPEAPTVAAAPAKAIDAGPIDGLKTGATLPPPGETGGPAGPEPTRYGDWEKGGRCFDF